MRRGYAPGIERLRHRPEFLAVAKGGRGHGALLTVQGLARAGTDDPARVGLTVSKRVAVKASERNRIRRRLRAAVALAAPAAAGGHDYVVLGRREVLGAPFAALVADLAAAMTAAGRPRRAREGGRHERDHGRGA